MHASSSFFTAANKFGNQIFAFTVQHINKIPAIINDKIRLHI